VHINTWHVLHVLFTRILQLRTQAIHGTDSHLFWRIRLLDPVKSSSRGASTGCHSWSSQSSMVPVVPKPPDLAELTELRRAIFQTVGSAKTNNPIAAKLSHHVHRKPLNPDATCLAPVLFCSPLVSRGSSHYGRGLPSCARHSFAYS